MMKQPTTNKPFSLSDFKKKQCEQCSHMPVCLIVRIASEMLKEPNFTEKTQPFKLGDLAKICTYHTNLSIEALKEKT